MLKDVWKDPKVENTFISDPAVYHEFINRASRALATAATGAVYVLLPAGTKIDGGNPKSTWYLHEWPSLQRAGVQVYRVDVDVSRKTAGNPVKIYG